MSLPTPFWAPDLAADGWTNIHDIVQCPGRLTGVDAWLGDPTAETLLLGKDCAPARVFRRLVRDGATDPYRHDPKLPTNLHIHTLLDHVGIVAPIDGSASTACGVYYANAYYLLRDDNRFSGPLPNPKLAAKQSARVLHYILQSLPRLRRVIAMGSDAYAAIAASLDIEVSWRRDMTERRILRADGISIVATSHPGYFGLRMRLPGAAKPERLQAVKDDWSNAFNHC